MAATADIDHPKVLVIDDEPDLRTLYEFSLVREGYVVHTAEGVAQALEALQSQRYDAVISDMRLQDGLGLDVLRFLSQQQRSERCVVITAYGSAENAVEALKAGAFDYLTKPVDLKQFRSVVAQAVRSSQAGATFSVNTTAVPAQAAHNDNQELTVARAFAQASAKVNPQQPSLQAEKITPIAPITLPSLLRHSLLHWRGWWETLKRCARCVSECKK